MVENYVDIGDFKYEVTTKSKEAQTWVNRALIQLFGFNHIESMRCFKKVLEIDPDCVFAIWGVSYCAGPHYNLMFMPAENYVEAHEYLKKADEKKGLGNNLEKDLIEALKTRYVDPMPLEGPEFHKKMTDFSVAMKAVYEKYPTDLTVISIYVEAVMNLRPWRLWTKEGKPHPEAVIAREVLEKALKQGYHPQIAHLYIHLLELSPDMKQAVPIANELYEKVKGSGHLLHMPSHIFIQCGEYKKSIESNQKGIDADFEVKKYIGENNFYTFYRAHNMSFLTWAAMFLGDYEGAIAKSELIKQEIHEGIVKAMGDNMEFFVHNELHVKVRFGKWDEILSQPLETRPDYTLYQAIQRYARAIAFAVLGKVDEAEKEIAEMLEAKKKIPEKRRVGNNTPNDIFNIAEAMSTGELLYRKKDYEKAFQRLREAVELTDNLVYAEPWDWPMPPRHALGALLLEQGHFEESEKVYKKDLEQHPNNIWALRGLDECFEKQGKTEERKKIAEALETASQNSKVEVKASCFCKQGSK